MSEPIKLYNVTSGEEMIVHSPAWAHELVASGAWVNTPPADAASAGDAGVTSTGDTDADVASAPKATKRK